MLSGVYPFSVDPEKHADASEALDGDSDSKDFSFKFAVLHILMNVANQQLLRGHLVIFRRIKEHHFDWIRQHAKPGAALRFYLMWSDMKVFFGSKVMNVVFSLASLTWGGRGDCSWIDSQSVTTPSGRGRADVADPVGVFVVPRGCCNLVKHYLSFL